MITYTFNGDKHVLSLDEFQAVEASGRSSWHDYATTPTVYPEHIGGVHKLMDDRPGKTEPVVGLSEYENNGTEWKPEDDTQLIRMVDEGSGVAAIALSLRRTLRAIECRIDAIDLRDKVRTGRERALRMNHHTAHPWSEEEDFAILEGRHVYNLTFGEIGVHINRSLDACSNRWHKHLKFVEFPIK